MINLIPKEERKKITIDFYSRIAILFFLTTGLVFILAAVVIVPSYFFSSLKNSIADIKLNTQKEEPVSLPDQQSLAIIKDLNHKLEVIESSKNNKFSVSKNVVNAILSKRIFDIKITNISYNNDATKGKTINIQGNAPSRGILLLFRKELEDSADFKQVDLPISNFVKESDIQFSLSLIPS